MPDKASPKKTHETIEQLNQQLEDLTSALQRERADATNMRRRHEDRRFRYELRSFAARWVRPRRPRRSSGPELGGKRQPDDERRDADRDPPRCCRATRG